MSHRIIITEEGTDGIGGKAVSQVDWTPSHDLTGNEQIRRVERAKKMLEKVNDMLYAPPPSGETSGA